MSTLPQDRVSRATVQRVRRYRSPFRAAEWRRRGSYSLQSGEFRSPLPSISPPSTLKPSRMAYELSHLAALEAESIHIMREVAAEFERPVLLFSGGKDS